MNNKKSIGNHRCQRRRRKILVGYTRIQVTVVWCPSPPGVGGNRRSGGGVDMGGGGYEVRRCQAQGRNSRNSAECRGIRDSTCHTPWGRGGGRHSAWVPLGTGDGPCHRLWFHMPLGGGDLRFVAGSLYPWDGAQCGSSKVLWSPWTLSPQGEHGPDWFMGRGAQNVCRWQDTFG